MGKLDYSTAQVNESVRKGVARCVAVATNETDNADVVVFSSGEATAGTYKLVPLNLATVLLNQFVTSTNGVQYKGSATRWFLFNGTAVVGSSAVNTTVHFRMALNGVTLPKTTSAVKLDTTTSLMTVDASSAVQLTTDSLIQVYAQVDKACTISVYHTQLQLVEV
jgi:hypothetical protein